MLTCTTKGREDRRTAAAVWPRGHAGGSDAQCNLGLMHADGQGGRKDLPEARRLFGLAAAQGFACAQFHLGLMHEDGEGGPQDLLEARRLYVWPRGRARAY